MLRLVRRSPRRAKKLVAVFVRDGQTIETHFGASGYGDYTTYWRQSPVLARAKRQHYIARHGARETWTDPAAAATLARYILWERPTVSASIAAFRRMFRV